MSDTLLASASRILWRLIKAEGADPETIFAEAGLNAALINKASARYPVVNARKAWQLAADKIKDPCFGLHAGAHWRPTDLHALGYAFLASRTLHTGLNRIVRYNEVVDQVIHFTAEALRDASDAVQLMAEKEGLTAHRASIEVRVNDSERREV